MSSSRHYSADSDLSFQETERDAKRLKSLDTQRAFRARKANHVKDLEVKVALQDIELAKLKRENQALRLEVENLKNGSTTTTATTGSAAKSTATTTAAACCNSKNTNQVDTATQLQGVRYIPHLDPQNAVNYEPVRPSVQHPQFPTAVQAPSNGQNMMLQSQPSYSTSTLPVVSVATRPVQPTYVPSTSPLPPSLSSVSNISTSPSLSLSTSDTSRSASGLSEFAASTHLDFAEPVIPQNVTAQLTQVVCCNGMFNCEEEEDGTEIGGTRWVKENTGVKGIGSNTVDDFYSLFGDHNSMVSTSSTG